MAHLVHVLEEQIDTTFRQFVNDRRVRFAAALLAEAPDSTINIGQIASQSGFNQLEEFDAAFQSLFDMSAEAYSRQAVQQAAGPHPDEPAKTG